MPQHRMTVLLLCCHGSLTFKWVLLPGDRTNFPIKTGGNWTSGGAKAIKTSPSPLLLVSITPTTTPDYSYPSSYLIMLDLLIFIVAFAVLYYSISTIVSFASVITLDGSGDHFEATVEDKYTPSTPFYSPEVTYRNDPPPRAHYNNTYEQPARCPVCYPPPPRVFVSLDPNQKYVRPVHSRDCPFQPVSTNFSVSISVTYHRSNERPAILPGLQRWVYSRRDKSIPTEYNSSSCGFTTDDLIDIRQVYPGDPDFDLAALPTTSILTHIPTCNPQTPSSQPAFNIPIPSSQPTFNTPTPSSQPTHESSISQLVDVGEHCNPSNHRDLPN